jgi:uncharacterized protein YhaN
MAEEDIYKEKSELTKKISKLSKEKKELDKKLAKLKKEEKKKQDKKADTFHDKIYKLFEKCVITPMGELYSFDDYWYDEGADQELFNALTTAENYDEKIEGLTSLPWSGDIDTAFEEPIQSSEEDVERSKKHLEGLKKFKKEILKLIKE